MLQSAQYPLSKTPFQIHVTVVVALEQFQEMKYTLGGSRRRQIYQYFELLQRLGFRLRLEHQD